ncbi:MAG: isomerase [Woeseia sp.]|nr:isomerase [Woeseia sp.]|tara:strand:- start:335 stop:1126 length:792 start_codon:yes stop_codon:yes gene_type:complete
MELPIYQAAAFTSVPFRGNPASVVPLEKWIDDKLMQKIAAENNLSETAFFVPTGQNQWHIRWFTPVVEVPLCGHATLATAAVIYSKLLHRTWPIWFESASGSLSVDIEDDMYLLDFPTDKPTPVENSNDICAVLGISDVDLWMARDMSMVVLDQESSVLALNPDFELLSKVLDYGLIVTAEGTSDEIDFVSRFFAPALGINEDPVTGSAHCVLTPYWSNRLGKKQLNARQISNRGGIIRCSDLGDRIQVGGRVVFFLSGLISI